MIVEIELLIELAKHEFGQAKIDCLKAKLEVNLGMKQIKELKKELEVEKAKLSATAQRSGVSPELSQNSQFGLQNLS